MSLFYAAATGSISYLF